MKCKCGNEKELEKPIESMGDVIMAGWGVVVTFDGKLLRCCPECHEEVKVLAKRIEEITGSKYVSLSNLLK